MMLDYSCLTILACSICSEMYGSGVGICMILRYTVPTVSFVAGVGRMNRGVVWHLIEEEVIQPMRLMT